MEQLTTEMVDFSYMGRAHLYKTFYYSGNIAICAGNMGTIGMLSVNLYDAYSPARKVGKNEFYVRLYGTGLYMNEPCFKTGLFEVLGDAFNLGRPAYQLWMLRT